MSDELICCRHPSVLAGGCYSGQVSWWDLRTGTSPTTVSASSAHTDPVYCLVWTSSKAGTEVGCNVVVTVVVILCSVVVTVVTVFCGSVVTMTTLLLR